MRYSCVITVVCVAAAARKRIDNASTKIKIKRMNEYVRACNRMQATQENYDDSDRIRRDYSLLEVDRILHMVIIERDQLI